MTRSRDIGTKAETAICRYLTGEIGAVFERGALRGRFDRGDIHAHEFDVTIEAKASKRLNLRMFAAQLEAERVNKATRYGVVIWKPPGVGYTRLDEWIAIEWRASALPAWTQTRTRLIPHVGPLNQLHRYVAQADQWGPVLATPIGGTPAPGDEDWIRLQHLHHWATAARELIAESVRHPSPQ